MMLALFVVGLVVIMTFLWPQTARPILLSCLGSLLALVLWSLERGHL